MLDPGSLAALSTSTTSKLAALVRRGRALRAAAARRDPDEFCAFVLRDEKTGTGVTQAAHHTEMQRIWSEHRESVIWACPESGKCETAASRVLLASGEWRSIANVTERTEIQILDPETMTRRTVEAGPVEENGVRPIVEVCLRSGRVLRVTEEHPVYTPHGWLCAGNLAPGDHLAAARTIDAPVQPVPMSEEEAALLGYLIGDGTLGLPSRVEFTNIDVEILEDVRRCCDSFGWRFKQVRPMTYAITREQRNGHGRGAFRGLRSPTSWVREHGSNHGAHKKRVPPRVFLADNAAVSAFVGAYFACDGSVNKKRAQLEFSSVSRALLEDVQLLLARLGIWSRVQSHHGGAAFRLFVSGFEALRAFNDRVRVLGPKKIRLMAHAARDVGLSSQCDLVPEAWRSYAEPTLRRRDARRYKFRLDKTRGNHRSVIRRYLADHPNAEIERLCSDAVHWDEILEVRRGETEMTYALEVHDEAHCYISNGLISHNSNQVVGRVLWELGHNPFLRVVFVSKTTDQSEKLLQLAKQYIEHSAELHEVFPKLRKSVNRTLPNHRRAFTAERDSYAIKDPSLRVTGLGGNILGARVDLIVMDDWLDFLSTRTESPRESAFGWARSNNCFGRLTDGGRIWVVTNAWHPQDANERLVTEAGFYAARFPSMTALPDEGGVPTYPERWTPDRLAREIRKLGPVEFTRAHLCKPRDDGSQVFRKEWIESCLKRGEHAGIFASLAGFLDDMDASIGEEAVGRAYQDVIDAGGELGAAIMAAQLMMADLCGRDGAPIAIIHGVDLAVEEHSAADLTAIFSIAVYANGDRRLLRVSSGRWDAPKIIKALEDVYFAFGGTVIVETAGQQKLLVQITRASTSIPVRGYRTGNTKEHPQLGLTAMATEVWLKKWIIPSFRHEDPNAPLQPANAEIQGWINDMLTYDPSSHTGDRLMSCVEPGALVTTAHGLVPIEDVRVGDLVLTHKGRFRRVTETMSRLFDGEAIHVCPAGLRGVVLTPEHPVWAADTKAQARTNRMIPKDWRFIPAGELHGGALRSGMFVLSPIPSEWAAQKGATPSIDLADYVGGLWEVHETTLTYRGRTITRHLAVTEELGLFLGLYLAEGWIAGGHQPNFAFHQNEWHLHEFICDFAERTFAAPGKLDQRKTKCLSVRFDSMIAARLLARLGKRAGKGLPWEWMTWPLDVRLAIVRGWLIGDGCLVTVKGRRLLSGVSVAPTLIEQMRLTLAAAGMLPMVERFKQSGEFQGKPCGQLPAQRLRLSECDSSRLMATSCSYVENEHWTTRGWDALSVPLRDRANNRSLSVPEGVAHRLRETPCVQYAGPVYNMHVEEDESYVVAGMAVHNCYFAFLGALELQGTRIPGLDGVQAPALPSPDELTPQGPPRFALASRRP